MNIPDGLIDPRSLRKLDRSTFIVFFQSGLHDIIRKKLIRVCEAFEAQHYDLPDDGAQYEVTYGRLQDQIQDVEQMITMTSAELSLYARYWAGVHGEAMPYERIYAEGRASHIEEVKMFLLREKAVYYHLNYFRVQGNMLTGSFWCRHSDLAGV